MNNHTVPSLLEYLRSANRETEWVEFKTNNDDPDEIGEYISALANSAALVGRPFGYIVWGVSNITHDIVGTTVRLHEKKIGNEDFEPWVARLLSPRVNFRIISADVAGEHVELIEVPAAAHTPVAFKHQEFIRVGSYKKPLREYPEKERDLWRTFERTPWETEIAIERIPSTAVLSLLDYPSYFELTKKPLPEDRNGILAVLVDDALVVPSGGDSFGVTNLGVVLFARDLSKWGPLARKAVRLVVYKGRGRTDTIREQVGSRGYASGFGGFITFLNDLLPMNEQITQAFRKEVRLYPEIAIRELIANALIHQDFRLTGTGPLVEVFADRIEIGNPGKPLVDTKRFLDATPRSRNERLAALMRRMNICEERGSGIDKVITAAEVFQLPAPRFDVEAEHTKVTLFAPRPLAKMTKEDRVRATYQHAALRYISNDRMTNTSLRERFAIADQNYSIASRIIRETMDTGLIKPEDPDSTSRKHARYVPFWA